MVRVILFGPEVDDGKPTPCNPSFPGSQVSPLSIACCRVLGLSAPPEAQFNRGNHWVHECAGDLLNPVFRPHAAEIDADQPFDEFLEASHRLLLARDPELVTRLGLTAEIGAPNNVLTDISDAYLRETQQLEIAILDALRGYDRETLTKEQKLSYDIYAWFLEDQIRGHAFMYYDYPVSHFLTGVQNQLVLFFTDLHPVRNKQEAEDYIARLWLVDEKFAQLIEGLQLRQDAGVILPKFIIQWTMNDINGLAGRAAKLTPFYTALEGKIAAVNSLDDNQKASLLSEADAAIEGSVLPAYHGLNDFLEAQLSIATDKVGAWQLPDGDAYYKFALQHHTTTDMTPAEVHNLGLQELARIHQEMRAHFESLGYPGGESLTASYARVAEAGGRLPGVEAVAEYEALIEEMEAHLDEVFDLRPEADVIVIGGATGGYYVAPALDGSRPGAFYASVSAVQSRFGMPTLTYHEAIPGHHMQIAIAIAQERDLSSFRRGSSFTAYVEGWALYAERLAWEMGLYESDPYGDLGRLQAEAFRASAAGC